jgi:putative Mn2+ efflux pump MntP
MNALDLFVLSGALAMDATAVAAARGLSAPEVRWTDAARVGALFGGFQALMPAIGWVGGTYVGTWAAEWSGWVAAVILGGLGGNMLRDALVGGDDDDDAEGAAREAFAWRALLPLAVATSIDALAAGVSLPLLDAHLVVSIAAIGTLTAALSGAAAMAGKRIGEAAGGRLNALGGVVLIAMAGRFLWAQLPA